MTGSATQKLPSVHCSDASNFLNYGAEKHHFEAAMSVFVAAKMLVLISYWCFICNTTPRI